MIPPVGFLQQKYPLRHIVEYAFGLSPSATSVDTAMATLLRNTNDTIAGTPASIVVNPHNTNYVEDYGPAVCKWSIIDKLNLSMKFSLTEMATTDGIDALNFLWRPIFFSFTDKLDAADDDTTTTVAAILGLTHDATYEDVVPVTTNKLPVDGASDKSQPVSTVNIAEVFGDYNQTTDVTMEDHVFDEDLLHSALRRYTNKGALRACLGRTRNVTLTKNRPYKNFYIDKFVPRAVRRVQPYTFMAIQVHVPLASKTGQYFIANTITGSKAHLGCRIRATYHEWNDNHFQEMSGTAP